jgi:hypothetical protein
MTETATLELTDYADKRVTITFRPDGSTESTTKEGQVQAASAAGLLFKERGKADFHIIEPDWIDSIEVTPEKEPKVTVKKLQPVTEGRVRQHLADRHGYLVEDLNAMTEASAAELHEQIDHNGLGHLHEVPQAQQELTDTTPVGQPDSEQGDSEPEEPEDLPTGEEGPNTPAE